VGQGPGPTSRCRQQGEQVHQQQDPLQSHGPRCTDKRQAREGAQAELPEPAQRGYGKPCNNQHQGLSCRWQGQPAVAGYRR